MSHILSKKAIRQKTVSTGSLTLASRAFGLIREILLARYLGNGTLSDAFITAFKIPNTLRKFFAEGALTSAFTPSMVQAVHYSAPGHAHSLMSMAFLFFEGMVLLLCALVMLLPRYTIYLLAPGFSAATVEQTVPMLIVLMPFIFFISGGALLAGALQAVHHYFIPAIAPVFLNFCFIIGASLGIYYQLSTTYLCFFILLGGLIQFIAHLYMYFNLSFSFGSITPQAARDFIKIFFKFIVCIPSMCLSEISLIIDSRFASHYIGGVSSLNYANRFMGIPLGVFATSFASILLPHFSRVQGYAPKRMSFYLFETSKLIIWVTLPVTLGMIFFSYTIFHTLFLTPTFPLAQVVRTSNVLIASVAGLFFFSLNKIMLNIFYSAHQTIIPTIIACVSTALNIVLNYCLIGFFEIPGLAWATTLAAAAQTVLSIFALHYYMKIPFYTKSFIAFCCNAFLQLIFIGTIFISSYYSIRMLLPIAAPAHVAHFLIDSIGLWLWVSPLALMACAGLYYSRKQFNIKLYFLD